MLVNVRQSDNRCSMPVIYFEHSGWLSSGWHQGFMKWSKRSGQSSVKLLSLKRMPWELSQWAIQSWVRDYGLSQLIGMSVSGRKHMTSWRDVWKHLSFLVTQSDKAVRAHMLRRNTVQSHFGRPKFESRLDLSRSRPPSLSHFASFPLYTVQSN